MNGLLGTKPLVIYNDTFQGKKTGSGEVYDKAALTAAHKKLPFGTKVKVTNVDNGESVVVTVNDRMAASKAGKAKVKLDVQK